MTGKLVYDVYMSAANLDSLPEVNLGPIGEATGDYSHTLVTLLNDNGGHAGEIQAGIGFGPYTSLGNYSTDAWHQVEADITNPSGLNGALNFSFKVDGVATGVTVSTTLTAAGLTTIEAGNNGTANNPASFVYVDNILAVPTPEPASLVLALVAFAGMCGYGWHRRRSI